MSKEQIKPMDWEEVMMNVGNPVYYKTKTEKRWRILEGYKKYNKTYSVVFTDGDYWERFQDVELYLKEV